MLGALLAGLVTTVDVGPDAPCLDAARVARLRAALDRPDSRLSFARGPSGALEVVLSSPGRPVFQRQVPVNEGACDAVERVVVSLVRAWLASPVSQGRRRDGGAVADTDAGSLMDGGVGAAPVRSTSEPLAPGAALPTDAGVVAALVRSTSDALGPGAALPTDAGVVAVRSTSDALAPRAALPTDAGVVAVRSTSEPLAIAPGAALPTDAGLAPAASDESLSASRRLPPTEAPGIVAAPVRWTLGVGLFAGIGSGATADVLPHGTLTLDVTRGWLGVALDVGLSGAVSRQVDPGSVSASWQFLSLSARGVWAVTRRLLLELQAGVRGQRLTAAATGFTQVEPPQVLLSVGGVASVGAAVSLVGPVGLSVRASGVVKPPERFVITNVGAVLDLGAFEGLVSAGVVARW